MKKNGFITFCCSLIPGFGQMYHGYMRRGVSLAFWFWGLAFVAGLVGLGVLAFLMPVIWAYSFFDTFNIHSLTPEQRANFRDDYIPNEAWLRSQKISGLLKHATAPKIVGWALVGFGALLLYNNFISLFYFKLQEYFPLLATIVDRAPQFLIAVAVILIGVWMLRGRKQPPASDDVTPFKGE